MMQKTDSRYPYTYAADALRTVAGFSEGSTKISRYDASQIRAFIAKAIGMDDENLAKLIADKYMEDNGD